jgi:para-aminobenzoate synthetase / 4-amino-4-deoxychorismate lyase
MTVCGGEPLGVREKLAGMTESADLRRSWHPLPDWFHALAARERGSVLLETAKFDAENYRTLLFRNPVDELTASSASDVSVVLDQIDRHVEEGRYAAGLVSYECGGILQGDGAIPSWTDSSTPLIRIGIFRAPLVFDHSSGKVHGDLPSLPAKDGIDDPGAAHIEGAEFQISEQEYADKFRRVQDYLAAGHSYQVNFTDRVAGRFSGSPMALYRGLVQSQPVPYAAFIDCGGYQILSLSPELFYRTENGTITVKPMKGTWQRGRTLKDDEEAAHSLLNDEKNRAEHVMIVDLLRNDVGKVSQMGTVQVKNFMQVERYRTIHQMTSTITGVLEMGQSPTQVFSSLFPSGSITGAPKRRTMQIIRELERTSRGVYTGAIGWFGPDGSCCFNVAIRTLSMREQRFTVGVGGGITVYSNAREEYAECKLKAAFLRHPGGKFRLIETMRAEEATIALLDAHLERLQKSAAYFQIPFDELQVRNKIAERLEARAATPTRVRLTLDDCGGLDISVTPLDVVPWAGQILLSSSRTDAADIFLHHKTTHRVLYDTAFQNARKDGFDEVLFMNELGFVTEGAISNIVLRIGGTIVTPDEASGVLPGIFRQSLLAQLSGSQSRPISLADLRSAEQIWFCNALRGCRVVRNIVDHEGQTLWTEPGGTIEDPRMTTHSYDS